MASDTVVFRRVLPKRMAISSRIPIVALVVSKRDRQALTSISGEGSWDVHFAESCEEARAVANQFTAAVILFDRNWPGTEWRTAVESLADSAHHACVILTIRRFR